MGEVPLFREQSAAALEAIRRLAILRTFPSGSTILRKGESGLAFFAIASGSAVVEIRRPAGPPAQFFLGPGEVFGEMSVLSDMPVSANLFTVEGTETYEWPKSAFLDLLGSNPDLQKSLIRMLVDRIRHRTGSDSGVAAASCVVLACARGDASLRRLARLLHRGVDHYRRGSILVDVVGPPDANRLPEPSPAEVAAIFGALSPEHFVGRSAAWCRDLVDHWRRARGNDRLLVLLVPSDHLERMQPHLRPEDAVLSLDATRNDRAFEREPGPARLAFAVPRTADAVEAIRGGPWRFQWTQAGVEAAEDAVHGGTWQRLQHPDLDWMARWITRREVGIALGAGAARGFAHLGVLDVLERAGLPLDYVCGSSMGGIVALLFARFGSIGETIEAARRLIGSNAKVRDVAWLPRSSFFSGRKVKRAALAEFGDLDIAALRRPAAVVAADLIRGERFILERGPMASAILATSAIPGVYPPVVDGSRLLVDGGLVSRIPLELLDRRRCGLRIAVNVVPSPRSPGRNEAQAAWLNRRIDRFLGLRDIIASSWELMAWWHGATEAERADILVEPMIGSHSGYDFDAIDELIESGREAALRQLPAIEKAVESLLTPTQH